MAGRFEQEKEWSISRSELATLYRSLSYERNGSTLEKLGPLKRTFATFLENERNIKPLSPNELVALFDSCNDESRSLSETISTLKMLAPGNGCVGYKQVNLLIAHLRQQVRLFIKEKKLDMELIPHHDTFGSGGDYVKTIHATTMAAIIIAPLVRICKTGTIHVTSFHGSKNFIAEIGYRETIQPRILNMLLEKYGFAYVSLAALGFPYSETLRQARKSLWVENTRKFEQMHQATGQKRRDILRASNVLLDIFKVVSPNVGVLNPAHRSTGVADLSMIPYVLATFLFTEVDQRGPSSTGNIGVISHCYHGIDEISNVSEDRTDKDADNLVIHIGPKQITIAEFSVEAIGFQRATFEEIQGEESLDKEVEVFWRILAGEEQGPKRDFVLANAALLIIGANQVPILGSRLVTQIESALKAAQELIDSGRAYRNLLALLNENINASIID